MVEYLAGAKVNSEKHVAYSSGGGLSGGLSASVRHIADTAGQVAGLARIQAKYWGLGCPFFFPPAPIVSSHSVC